MFVVLVALGLVSMAGGVASEGPVPIGAIEGRGSDFDGDGRDDLAVGVAGENTSGLVQVFYSRGAPGFVNVVSGLKDESIHRGVPGAEGTRDVGAGFGAALAVGDFDGDGGHDLAVGVPDEVGGSGEVHVFYSRGAGGLRTADGVRDQVLHLGLPGSNGAPEAFDGFGATLAAGDFDDDGRDDLAVGMPSRAGGAGQVRVFYSLGSGGLRTASGVAGEAIHQDVRGANGRAEPGDRFGASLAAGDFDDDGRDDLAVGVPGENGAGHVNVYYSRGAGGLRTGSGVDDETLHQGVRRANGRRQPGDGFGTALVVGDFDADGRDDLAVGVPGDDDRLGAAQVFYSGGNGGLVVAGTGVDDERIHRGVAGADGSRRSNDGFGSVLAVGDLDANGRDDLVVASPTRSAGRGEITVFYSRGAGGLRTPGVDDEVIHLGLAGANELRVPGDNFGAALAVGDFDDDGRDDLAVGSPHKGSAGGGQVNIFFGRGFVGLSTTLGVRSQAVHQDVQNANGISEPGDLFGASLPGSPLSS